MWLQRVRHYFCHLGQVDPRSLACCRIALSLVILYDIALAWPLLNVWLGMQGLYAGLPLPLFLRIGSDEPILRVIFAGYALLAVGLLLGYKTRWCTLLVWIVSCGHQYAARATIDYHTAIIVNLLFWCQALDLGAKWSVDAWRRPSLRQKDEVMAQIGAVGLVCTFAYIYLATALEKSDPAWWSEGTALWLALKDLALSSTLGTWAVSHLPFALFYHLAHLVLAVEYIAPILLLCPWWRVRLVGCVMLVALHAGIWAFMELDGFPATMIAGAAALLPAAFWQRLQATSTAGRLAIWWTRFASSPTQLAAEDSTGVAQRHLLRWALAALFASGLLINIEGHRLLGLEKAPYAGSEWVERLKYMSGLEVEWTMFAPYPPSFSGWWLAVGRTADGRQIDPITGRPPTLQKPQRGTFPLKGLGAAYWFSLPTQKGAPEYTYGRFLLWQDERQEPPEKRLTHLTLLFMCEPFLPIQNGQHPIVPVVVLRWPEGVEGERPPLGEDSILRDLQVYEVDYDEMGKEGWEPTERPRLRTF